MPAGLDAARDREVKRGLDRGPAVDKTPAILDLAAQRRTRDFIRTYFSALFGPGRLSADEFFYYALHRRGFTPETARAFVGKRRQGRLHRACNDKHWFAAADDKALFYTVMQGTGLPVPETVALLAQRPRGAYESEPLTEEGLTRVLARVDEPLFAKPVAGIYSLGSFVIDGLRDGRIEVRGQGRVTVGELVGYMLESSPQGYLLQRLLKPHQEMTGVTGQAVPSLRFLAILGDEVRLLSAVLKLPMAGNAADNFWRQGNGLAAVDLESGTIGRIVISEGSGRWREMERPAELPPSVPDWDASRDIVLRAATVLPGIRTQSWDVALTDRGPVLIELNFGGDLNLHQLAHDRGALSKEYCAHLRACGYRGRTP